MKTVKNAKKTFIAVSMVAFAAMMFSCAGTNKNAPVAQESVQVQEPLDNSEVAAGSEATSENQAEENVSEQNAAQNEAPAAAQDETAQNSDVSASVSE